MHVLIIPSWFSNSHNPLEGIFFREQAEQIQEINQDTIGIIYCHAFRTSSPVSKAKLLRSLLLRQLHYDAGGVPVIRTELLFIPQVPETKSFGASRFLNSIVRRINAHRLRKKYDFLLKTYIRTFGTPDLIHIQSAKIAGSVGLYISNKIGRPYILTEHWSYLATPNLEALPNNIANVYQQSQNNFAVSRGFCHALSSISGTEFGLIPNFTDTDFFTPDQQHTGKQKKTIFSSIGNLVKIKNFEMLILAFSMFESNNSDAQLHIGGSGPELESLKDLVKQKNLTGKVYFLGQLDRYQVRQLIRQTSIFILPSIRETFGVVLIESLSCGVPVIAVRSWGPETIVTSDNLGLLCENSPESMYTSMISAHSNLASYSKNAIREHILANFSKNVVAQKMLEEYQRYAK